MITETKFFSLDGIRKTNVYRIIPRVITKRVPLHVPLPPRIRMLRSMLSAVFLLIILTGGWIGMTVSANRTLSIDGLPLVDATTIPFPNDLELIGPIPLSTSEPDAAVVTAAFTKLLGQYRESAEAPTVDEVTAQAEQLRQFFKDKGSPLADDSLALEILAQARNKRMMIAITFVESNYCAHQMYFNCSGIGGSSNFRHYRSFANWILDFNELLERRYNGLSPEEMNGYYVQPRNARWVNGIYGVLEELKARGIE